VAYDHDLAERARDAIAFREGVTEREMFGGITFMLAGNMACGVIGDELMVRVGPEQYEAALAEPGTRPMDFTGRAMKGMVYVAAKALLDDAALAAWVDRGASYAGSLPAK
jgi:TfoX/Sxy family transcriptional regulator of competence genes